MPEQFIVFQSFSDLGLAQELSKKLTSFEIEHRLEKVPAMLDSNILGVTYQPDISIKLHAVDFTKASNLLVEYYKPQVEMIGTDYYLYDFSNEELLEILAKPDEWNPLDFHLSLKILKSRGIAVSEQQITTLKEERVKELAKPEKTASGLITIGYIFIFFGFVALINILTKKEFNFFPGILLFGAFLGSHLSKDKKTLPDGRRLFCYNNHDRFHGGIIFYISVGLLVLTAVLWIVKQSINH